MTTAMIQQVLHGENNSRFEFYLDDDVEIMTMAF